jgi:hypothetical protein
MQQKQLPVFQCRHLCPVISDSGHWTSAFEQHACIYFNLRHSYAYRAATSVNVRAQQSNYKQQLYNSCSLFFSVNFFGFSDGAQQQQPQLIRCCLSNLRTLAPAAAVSESCVHQSPQPLKFQHQRQRC